MKYWNKQKELRIREWTVAPAPNDYLAAEAKRWCQNHQSMNRFYFHYTNTQWWFENKSDALHFALVWGNNDR